MRKAVVMSVMVVMGANVSAARAHDGRCLIGLTEVVELISHYIDARNELLDALDAHARTLYAGVGRDILEVDLEAIEAAVELVEIAEQRDVETLETWYRRLTEVATGPCSQ